MPHDAISITINPNDPESIRRALNTEWLITNGLGGYAMGTVLGVNTRRYHGLHVAATKPPLGRIVALHSMIEQLVIPREDGTEEVIDLSTQQFVGPDGEPMLHPGGCQYLKSFELSRNQKSAVWNYQIGECFVLRAMKFVNVNTIGCAWSIWGITQPVRLRVRPLIPLRDFHSLTEMGSYDCKVFDNSCRVSHLDRKLTMEVFGISETMRSRWIEAEQSWHNFAYIADRERQQDWTTDIWTPGYYEAEFIDRQRRSFHLLSNFIPVDSRKITITEPAPLQSESNTRLLWAAPDFVVERRTNIGRSTSVIAGYPWFGDWGRDTMIALPGLMLCTNRYDEARSCLMMFAKHIKNGLIPNHFDDYGGAAHYNTVDASLWFVHAVHEYSKATNSIAPGQSPGLTALGSRAVVLDACRSIIAAYRNGTDFNIRMDDDGLIAAGDETTQLTWMDAKRDGVVFTPRHGKAVEINALWFNALRCLAEMTDDSNERDELLARSRRAAESFRAKFWWNKRQCLHDVLHPVRGREAASGQLRPNQIFAVSLPFSPLNEDQQRAVVNIVGERLLTPFGLRTLDRDDPNYRGRYEGNMFERDRAYHNGTVWPWLIGPYCESLLRVNEFGAKSKKEVRQIIQPLIDEMTNTSGGRCLGQIAEVYDGDSPHRPNGCPAQAWSVAEVLRIQTMIE